MKIQFVNFIKLVFFIFVLLATGIIMTTVQASELITKMDDLPVLDAEGQTDQMRSMSIEDDLVILYENPGENNIGSLELKKADFASGISKNTSVDVLRVSGNTETDTLIEEISEKENVAAVSRDYLLKPQSLPSDPLINKQNGYTRVGADQVWNTPGPNTVKVAVLDSGISTSHLDLRSRVENSGVDYSRAESQYDGVDDFTGHGTSVASVIAAETNNNIGIAGIAGTADVKLVSYRVTRPNGDAPLSNFASAVIDICNRDDIKVISISYGASKSSEVEKLAYEAAEKKGIVIVAASGNEDSNSVCYPAANTNVIGVGAINNSDGRCTPAEWGSGHGSNYGAGLNIMAPGDLIATCKYDPNDPDLYRQMSGTSFSTPIVAGACALMFAKNPALTAGEVRDHLYASAADLGDPGYDEIYGFGVLQIPQALARVSGTSNPEESIILNNATLNLKPGEEQRIDTHSTGNSPLVFSSDNSAVASVDQAGLVHAYSPGKTRISISLQNRPTIQTYCTINVTSESPEQALFDYNSHVSNIGWLSPVVSGQISGTTGQSLALEAFRVDSKLPDLGFEYSAYVENIGWQPVVTSGNIAGTTGQGLQIEALNLKLTGDQASNYDLYYRTHVAYNGWTAWATNGENCGTSNQHLRLEALQIVLVPKGAGAPTDPSDVDWVYII